MKIVPRDIEVFCEREDTNVEIDTDSVEMEKKIRELMEKKALCYKKAFCELTGATLKPECVK